MKDDWEPRPSIYPAEWLEEMVAENKPLPKFEIDFLQAFHGLDAPYTVEEVKKMFPGLYFPLVN